MVHAAFSARIKRTDRNDALGIAQMMRVGLFKPVHVKTLASQQRRLLLVSRKLLQALSRRSGGYEPVAVSARPCRISRQPCYSRVRHRVPRLTS
jgi:hypothetical protein